MINAIIALSLQKSKQALTGTGAKRDVCRGSSVSSGGKVPACLGGVGAYGERTQNSTDASRTPHGGMMLYAETERPPAVLQ